MTDLTGRSGESLGARAVVLHPFIKSLKKFGRDITARLDEAVGLAAAINLQIVIAENVPLPKIRAGSYFGKGTVDRLHSVIESNNIDLVCVDTALSPVQQRTLEEVWGVKVIDRTGLILEIFGERAATREGVLQVELAHLDYQRSRLVRTWTHLERQRGGFGFLGGPGETQIEADRRMIFERIIKIRRELKTVTRTRELHRKARRRVPYPIVALVGYTNAGKSTLFNKLTDANVLAEDLLFATLDPTMREVRLPSGRSVILSDTVGFVSDLPTTLIAAFRATLEEVISADIIVHIRDIAHPDTNAQKADVLNVMSELGINLDENRRSIEILNKADLLNQDELHAIENHVARTNDTILMSALTGVNKVQFLEQLDQQLSVDRGVHKFQIHHSDGATVSWLYRNADVLNRNDEGEHIELEVAISSEQLARFEKKHSP